MRLDPDAGTFTSEFFVNGRSVETRTAIALRPDHWRLKCGIDTASLAAGTTGPYVVKVERVQVATCSP